MFAKGSEHPCLSMFFGYPWDGGSEHPWLSMLFGYPRISLDIDGYPLIFCMVRVHGYPLLSLDSHGYPCLCMASRASYFSSWACSSPSPHPRIARWSDDSMIGFMAHKMRESNYLRCCSTCCLTISSHYRQQH